ncbi:serine/threonine-protein kinase [Janibacter corallicola]|uniref:serine/threonine-protein kinase n=1 Tax=Janibacter corallicola TaxID=415212 RepID=UPI0008319BB5|nr:serine/threonine-protein kinase [Janibacter corallicola]
MSDETSRELIAGRYEVVRQIGRGSGGAVWLAQDSLLGRHVAIKQIGAFPGESEADTRRAIREARQAAALNHPNVVAVYDVVEYDEVPWLVMEYVDGPTLASAIRERGPMAQVGVADLGAQLAAALSASHRAGVVHGDIKPSNVLIGQGRPKISDFGIARSNVEQQFTQVGVAMGTPNFTAPEVAVGGKQTGAADVWSLGATLYYAIEGREAFPLLEPPLATLQYIATNPPRTPQRAGALEPILADMLSRDPNRRGTMADISRRLEHLAAGERMRANPPAAAGAGSPGPTAAGAAAAGAAGGAVGGAAAATGAPGPADPTDAPGPEGDAQAPEVEGAGVEDEAGTEMHMVTEPPRADGGSTIAWVVAIILALLLAALAVGIVGIGDDEGSAASTTSSTSEDTPESEAPEAAINFVERAGTFVQHYYKTAPKDPSTTWNQLSESAQEAEGDESDYVDFWNGVKKVKTDDLAVDPESGKVTLKVTYEMKGGKTKTEKVNHVVKDVDGQMLIEK